MPPTEQMIDDAALSLSRVRLESFSLEPDTIIPFQRATLSWRVSVDGDDTAGFGLRLTGPGLAARVPLQGTRNVSPTMSGTYTLRAVRPPFSQVLATRAIEVDSSDCIDGAILEPEVQANIQTIVDLFLADKPDLRRRGSGETVSIGTPGILVELRFKSEIENWADPDVNVRALIKIHAEGGQIKHNIAQFEFDVDFPWWADLAHGAFMPVWLAVALKEGNQGAEVREFLDNAVETMLAGYQASVESAGYRFVSAQTDLAQVTYTICPAQALTSVGLFTKRTAASVEQVPPPACPPSDAKQT